MGPPLIPYNLVSITCVNLLIYIENYSSVANYSFYWEHNITDVPRAPAFYFPPFMASAILPAIRSAARFAGLTAMCA